MTDWIQSIATIILGAATIALFWVTKTLARSTNRLAHISGQDFRAKHSPIPFLLWHKDTPAIEGGNIVLKGAIRPFPGSPSMTLISILAESSVEYRRCGSSRGDLARELARLALGPRPLPRVRVPRSLRYEPLRLTSRSA